MELIARSTTRGGQVSTSAGPWTVRRGFPLLGAHSVIEVDGSQHTEQVSNDLRRTEYLKVSGYRVLRFWNHDVLGNPDAVLESIRAALVEIPSPPPLYVVVVGIYEKIVEAVEVVGKGARGGKRAAFSTASAPVRQRRIVHKSTALRRLGAAARPALGTSSPWESKERRAVFSD